MKIDFTITPIIGVRYFARSKSMAARYGDKGVLQIYAYKYRIDIDTPWKHVEEKNNDIAIIFSPWRKN
ncbi:TPA: hypothetical protein MI729_000876 [Klebsiella aerogenes]|nr:hypothetical protein [Klebsiella aerogenes]